MNKKQTLNIIIALGLVLSMAGYIKYDNSSIWGFGIMLIIIGLAGKRRRRE